jgi:UDP-N-acetylmuramate dehydrogenase
MEDQDSCSSVPAVQRGVAASDLTTLGVGGECESYVEVRSLEEFVKTYEDALEAGLPTLTIGEGSNLLFSDSGFAGRVIRNRICGRTQAGEEVEVGGGENLSEVIQWLNQLGLAGMERMYGIPGTIAGALVGNAGAYGQEIADTVTRVEAWNQGVTKSFSRNMLQLGYRHSYFKEHREWFVLSCELRLQRSEENLQMSSEEILTKRLIKYPAGLKCPGSFFKNVLLSEISPEALGSLSEAFVIGGKVSAGKLLEAVGAKGARRGDAQFADYHGNLIINRSRARSEDILTLAGEYARRVLQEFGIRLEPEILIVDDSEWPRWGQ